jgi:sigma-B regulation protein RsbU (phosphoserine phosphatase)
MSQAVSAEQGYDMVLTYHGTERQSAMLSSLNERILEFAKQNAQLLLELETARRVQQRLFPGVLPNSPGWEFAAQCRPARAVAGDYYDLFEVSPGEIAIALGDVSGKGLGPSLVMAGLREMIRSRIPQKNNDLAGLIYQLNNDVVELTPEDMFVTLFLGILDQKSGRFRFVNSGHPSPIVLASPRDEPTNLLEGGVVLGVVRESRYSESEIFLEPGSLLVLYSDGITEARNDRGTPLDKLRLLDGLRTASSLPAPRIVDHIFTLVQRFTGESHCQDDMTLVIVRRSLPWAREAWRGCAGRPGRTTGQKCSSGKNRERGGTGVCSNRVREVSARY